jgi:hypothetical protein
MSVQARPVFPLALLDYQDFLLTTRLTSRQKPPQKSLPLSKAQIVIHCDSDFLLRAKISLRRLN